MSVEVIIAALLGVLTGTVGWVGSRAVQRLDSLWELVHQMREDMIGRIHAVNNDVHEHISNLNVRVTAIESKCGLQHTLHAHRREDDE